MDTQEQSWASFLQVTLKYAGPAKAETGKVSRGRNRGMGLKVLPRSDFVAMREIRRCILQSPACRKNSFISLFCGTQAGERLLPRHVVSALPELRGRLWLLCPLLNAFLNEKTLSQRNLVDFDLYFCTHLLFWNFFFAVVEREQFFCFFWTEEGGRPNVFKRCLKSPPCLYAKKIHSWLLLISRWNLTLTLS